MRTREMRAKVAYGTDGLASWVTYPSASQQQRIHLALRGGINHSGGPRRVHTPNFHHNNSVCHSSELDCPCLSPVDSYTPSE
jgi:hypothetical protein